MRRAPRLITLLLAAGLLFAACGDNGATSDPATITLGEGGFAPDAADIQTQPDGDNITDLAFSTLDGGTDGFANHLDKPLVVNFFAAWCGPCRAEMPDFQQVFQDLGADVNFVGISRDDIAAPSLELIAETGVTYPTGWDQSGELFPELGLFAMPTTLFVNTDGVIVDQWGGILTGDALRNMIDEQLL